MPRTQGLGWVCWGIKANSSPIGCTNMLIIKWPRAKRSRLGTPAWSILPPVAGDLPDAFLIRGPAHTTHKLPPPHGRRRRRAPGPRALPSPCWRCRCCCSASPSGCRDTFAAASCVRRSPRTPRRVAGGSTSLRGGFFWI